ncbi:hypothetical protein [Streptomyces sp. NPDC005438]|uniref:hypothetical protein n=1 Tax=Streptomyces sp. NPDC005438 TaxID=3156880 RepID=UPI00339EA9C6
MSEPLPGGEPAKSEEGEPATTGPAPAGDGAVGPTTPGEGREPRAREDAPEGPAAERGPRPLGVEVEPTGHLGVDAGLARLADADRLDVADHLGVYEEVHQGLRETLTALDRPTPAGPPAPTDPRS